MCDKNCHSTSCPFAFTDESETIQNYGCLPTPYQIVSMRVIHGKTWACHSNPTKPCIGALKFMAEHKVEYKIIDTVLVTEHNLTKELLTLSDAQHNHISNLLRYQPPQSDQ